MKCWAPLLLPEMDVAVPGPSQVHVKLQISFHISLGLCWIYEPTQTTQVSWTIITKGREDMAGLQRFRQPCQLRPVLHTSPPGHDQFSFNTHLGAGPQSPCDLQGAGAVSMELSPAGCMGTVGDSRRQPSQTCPPPRCLQTSFHG